jgi:hypothetical protein
MPANTKQLRFNYLSDVKQIRAGFEIPKQDLHDRLITTILKACNLRVYGYNAHYDAFWGKKTQANGRQYSFELSLLSTTEMNTIVMIETLAGDKNHAFEIIASIRDAIFHKNNTNQPIARTALAYL